MSVLGASGGCLILTVGYLMNAMVLYEPAELARLYRTTHRLPLQETHHPRGPTTGWFASRFGGATQNVAVSATSLARVR